MPKLLTLGMNNPVDYDDDSPRPEPSPPSFVHHRSSTMRAWLESFAPLQYSVGAN